MTRKCIISAVVMFVMAWGLSFVVHGLLLGADYQDTPGMRSPAQAQQIIGYLILAQAIFGVAFAWVYLQGKEHRPWLMPVSYTHLRAHETGRNLVCRLL